MDFREPRMDFDTSAALAFLRQHSVAVLATANRDGVPAAAATEYGVTPDLEIIFDTYITYRKYANLKVNPQVALVVGWDQATLQYEGRASEVSGVELDVVKDIFFGQVSNARKFEGDRRTRWFCVKPSLIRYRDYRVSDEDIAELVIECESVTSRQS